MQFSGYDFFDFGCSNGGNIRFTKSVIPEAKGLGIDIDERKIDLARSDGLDVINYDILSLPDRAIVDFVTMAHFLEHIPGVQNVHNFVAKGVAVARDFVHIRQPFFDGDGYLMAQGLKLYWSDWTGHRNAMTTLDAYKMCRALLRRGQIKSFAILGRGLIRDSVHEAVIPLAAPIDSLKYLPEYGAKPAIEFSIPVYAELVLDIVKRENPRRSSLLAKLREKASMDILFASAEHEE